MQSDEGYPTQYCSTPVCSIECCEHPSRFQSPRNVQQHSFGGPHIHLEVEHTHGMPGEGDTQPLGSAEGLANHVDEPSYPMEFNPCPW